MDSGVWSQFYHVRRLLMLCPWVSSLGRQSVSSGLTGAILEDVKIQFPQLLLVLNVRGDLHI